MNKKLLTAAIAAGLMVPGLAAADVKIFGVIQAETGNVDLEQQGGGNDTSTTLNDANNGAINGGGPNTVGFKGSEKLGNGLTAYFKLSYEFNTFDSEGQWDARDSFVGLKGKGWHVQFGEMSSLYKTASHKYDPFVATGLQMRGRGGVSGLHNGYAEDIGEIGFKSGNWSGGIQVKWEDETPENNTAGGVRNSVESGSWNGRIMYKTKSWEASLSYMNLDYAMNSSTGTAAGTTFFVGLCSAGASVVTNAPGVVVCSGSVGTTGAVAGTTSIVHGDMDAWKIAGKWKGNGFTVAAQYESMDADNTAASGGGVVRPDGGSHAMGNGGGINSNGHAEGYDSLMIAVSYKMSGNTSIHGTYANTDHDDLGGVAGADMDANHWAIGVTHSLSKRTMIYGGYADSSYDYRGATPDEDMDAWGIGLRHKF